MRIPILPTALFFITAFPPVSYAQEPDPSWDLIQRQQWESFRDSPWQIDACAVPIALDRQVDERNRPAICTWFGNTQLVVQRVKEIRFALAGLSLLSDQRMDIQNARVWIGAPSVAVEVALGRPEKLDRTVTATGTCEHWMYYQGHSICIENGLVTAIQNHSNACPHRPPDRPGR